MSIYSVPKTGESDVQELKQNDSGWREERDKVSLAWVCLCVCRLSHVWLFVTRWIVDSHGPLSMEFSRHEYWSGLPFHSPGNLPDPGIGPASLTLSGRVFTTEPPGKHRVERNNFLKKGHFKWTLNGCHFNRWWSVRGTWVEVLGRRAQGPGCLEKGKQAMVESFRSRQRICRDKNGGRKKCVVSGQQLMVHFDNSEHRTQYSSPWTMWRLGIPALHTGENLPMTL